MKRDVWYHPELDVLRFAAFLGVFAFHATGNTTWAGMFRAGSYGVDLFFALSAYLITEVLLREKRERGNFDIGAFYVRRILRIWPLYFTFLAIAFWVTPLVLTHEAFSWPARIMHLVFLGNWVFLLHQPFNTSATLLWSVSIEEQFYLLWPIILRWWRFRLRWICIGIFALTTAYRLGVVLSAPSNEVDVLWRSTFSRLDAILLGSMLALWLDGRTPEWNSRLRWMIGGSGLAGMVLVAHYGAPSGWRALATYPSMAALCVLILAAVLCPSSDKPLSSLARLPVHLGRISYGLYVFHVACLRLCRQLIYLPDHPRAEQLLELAAAALLTLLLAECSYWGLERPFLQLKKRFSTVRTDPEARITSIPSPAGDPVFSKAS